MGWDARDVGFAVSLRLDAHGGDKERAHEQLADELAERLSSVILSVLSDKRFAEVLLFEPGHYVSAEPPKWRQVVTLLEVAERLVDGEDFGGYVDVSSAAEALTEVREYAQWKAYEDAGPPDHPNPARSSRRIVDGKPLTFNEYWRIEVE